MTAYIEKAETLTVPVIPLRGVVSFPSIQLNLDIQRGLSLKAFREAAAANDARVLLLCQKDPSVDSPKEQDLYKIGTLSLIKSVAKNPEGGLQVTFEGICRAKVLSFVPTDDFLRAEIMCKSFRIGAVTPRIDAMMQQALHLLEEYRKLQPQFTEEMQLAASALQSPGILADFIASSALVNFRNKQAVLEKFNPIARLEHLLVLMEEELDILRCEHDIHTKVHQRMDENQKEYYLREQLKQIQQELGDDPDEIEEYEEKIRKASLPKEVEEKLHKELNRLSKTPYGAAESTVLRNYLDACLEIPWNRETHTHISVSAAKKILENDHDGLEKVKERILEYIAVKALTPSLKNQTLCLVGPPGIGKTSIAASIARATGRKYVRVSLGGIRDEADIRGHRKTYVGAMPGRLIEALTTAGVRNPLIVLDEIDKITRDTHGDPASALLEALDPEQNRFFRDHFIELPVDLSDCLFIATANTAETIPTPLLDRMEVIELPTYSDAEKLAIAEHHLLKKQMKRHGLTARQLKVPDRTLSLLIRYYTKEAGVRNLEREIASLCRKAALRIAQGEIKSLTVRPEDLPVLMGKYKYNDELPETTDPGGVVNGLAYNQYGGDLLRVEVAVLEGTGKIELTGSLGDVMKESAHIALSYVRSIAAQWNIAPDFYKTKDLHIHFPEGAVPKDGPSAGVTMVVAIVSALTGRPVRRTVAMTGEMTLRGRVLPIGGLKEKTLAAYRAGIQTVLIPRENLKDLDECDRDAVAHLHILPCDTAADALEAALVPLPTATAEPEMPHLFAAVPSQEAARPNI